MAGAEGKMLARELLIRAFATAPALRNKRAHRDAARTISRILVFRPDHLGDLLFATPALDMLRDTFPQAHITGAVGPWGRAMWAGNPNLDALEVLAFPGMVTHQTNALAPYRLLATSAKQLAKGRYDLGVVLRFDHWWGAALLWAAGIQRRWGYRTPGMQAWLTNTVPYQAGKHEVEQNLRLVQAVIEGTAPQHRALIEIDRNKGLPPLTPPVGTILDEDMLQPWLAAEPKQRAIIHPGTAAANKLWTIGGWAEVADRLAAEGWNVALTGSPDEKELCARIFAASNSKPVDLAGRTANIGQLTSVMERAEMVLGVDSGPLHIADALRKKTLHLYGPSDETIWGPWGNPRLQRAFRAPNTHPTGHLTVGSPELEGGTEMRAITVEMVMQEARTLEIRN